MSRQRSVVLDVDGEPIRLCGVGGDLDDVAAAAIADVVRAARARLAGMAERCLDREDGRHLLCLRDPGHEPPHRAGTGREWT